MPRFASIAVSSVLAALIAGAVGAQDDGPAFDCARAEGDAETLVCEDAGLAALDRRMAERFAAAVSVVRGLDADADEAELRATQRGWIKGRNECWKTGDLRDCVENAYYLRENELVALYLLEDPTAKAAWTCEGIPANEVAVWFFDTERPSIRIEYGDTVDAGSLVAAASGARYAASFGREFWETGDEARFTWTEGEPMTCLKVRE